MDLEEFKHLNSNINNCNSKCSTIGQQPSFQLKYQTVKQISKISHLQQIKAQIKPVMMPNLQNQRKKYQIDVKTNLMFRKIRQIIDSPSSLSQKNQSQNTNQETFIINRTCNQQTIQSYSHFAQKFKWKRMPKKLQLKNQRTSSQGQKNATTLSVQKNRLVQTKVSINGPISKQFNKHFNNYKNDQNTQKNTIQQNNNRPKQINKANQFYLFENNYKNNKLRYLQILEIQSLTQSQISQTSSKSSVKNYIIDESLIQWTYQNRFKYWYHQQLQFQAFF